MGNSISDMVVHVNEDLDNCEIEAIDSAIRELDGVISVGCQADKQHLFVVSYLPEVITAKEILDTFIEKPFGNTADLLPNRNLHAQMVGL
ncbi:MAG: hypothetical protein HQL69_08815 [Magnetococcales bacterium]|nr:hypothetical protein [Magnetococcales bacterium]